MGMRCVAHTQEQYSDSTLPLLQPESNILHHCPVPVLRITVQFSTWTLKEGRNEARGMASEASADQIDFHPTKGWV